MTYKETGYESERSIAYMQMLEERLEKNPYDVQALIEKGFLCIDPFLRVEEGVAVLELAVKLDPTNANALFWLAEGTFHGLCDYEKTKKILETALSIDSQKADCHKLLASVLNSLNEDPRLSIYHLKKTIELEPTWILPRISLSYYYFDEDNIAEAEQVAQEALKIYLNSTFPITKTPIDDYYLDCITGCYQGIKSNIDNLFLAIDEKRKEFHGAQKSKP